jgi:outer membrane receptor for ferric coprogen and ferric-rhodotorulic acid
MNIYTPTKQEEDALFSHLKNYYDNIYELNHEFNFSLNSYDEALQRKDKEWQEQCINDMEMLNQRIKAIYKGANLIATAYKETETLY